MNKYTLSLHFDKYNCKQKYDVTILKSKLSPPEVYLQFHNLLSEMHDIFKIIGYYYQLMTDLPEKQFLQKGGSIVLTNDREEMTFSGAFPKSVDFGYLGTGEDEATIAFQFNSFEHKIL